MALEIVAKGGKLLGRVDETAGTVEITAEWQRLTARKKRREGQLLTPEEMALLEKEDLNES